MSGLSVEELRRLDGLFVGQLSETERDYFEQAVADGLAWRSYEGAAGMLGIPKVRTQTPRHERGNHER